MAQRYKKVYAFGMYSECPATAISVVYVSYTVWKKNRVKEMVNKS